MQKRNLTFGIRLGISMGILGIVIVLLAAVGLRTLGTTEEALARTVENNARKLDLTGRLNAAASDMAVGQRGVIMFTYAKNPAGIASAEALFQESSAKFQKICADLQQLVVTPRGKDLMADIERRMAQWLPAYAELRRFTQSGDPDGAV